MTASAAVPQRERLERLGRELAERSLDALIVQRQPDLRYLTGFTGSSGLALLLADPGSAGRAHRFLTDFRYRTQSGEQLRGGFELEIATGELLDALPALLPAGAGRLAYDDAQLSVKAHARLTELMPDGWELVAGGGIVERLRAVKEPGEIELMRAAAELADDALRGVLEQGIVGRTEREVALELELRMRRLGAEAVSFPPIVAAGAHAALPHAQPREVAIPREELVIIDWGALHEGYCSDCTRTYATGEGISAQARELYELVLDAQQRGLAALRAGPSGREVDAAAREAIERAGYAEQFGHGLGHGVGMEVHEAPRLSRTAAEEPLQAGNVVTVEPGVYIPGALGVRIEDLAVVEERASRVLTGLPKELAVLA